MCWFRVCEEIRTDEGSRLRFVDRILAASYSHAYELAERMYGRRRFDIASVPPFTEDRVSVACNLRPLSFIRGL